MANLGQTIFMIAVLVLVPPALTLAGTVDLPETGQTTCYDALGAAIDCGNTGQDGQIQAGVSWPSPRFTDSGNGTVTDNLTGLVWLEDGNCFGTQTWQSALDTVADFNANPGSYSCRNYSAVATDWRLANINEIDSLVNLQESNMATWLNTQGFWDVQADEYWSSTSDTLFREEARSVDMMNGSVYRGSKEFSSFRSWPVRAGQMGSPAPSYPANVWKTATWQ